MKYFFVLCAMILSCSSDPEKRKQNWDSGAARGDAFDEESINRRDSSVNDQSPILSPTKSQLAP